LNQSNSLLPSFIAYGVVVIRRARIRQDCCDTAGDLKIGLPHQPRVGSGRYFLEPALFALAIRKTQKGYE
jgi:hypothetical protein